MPRKPCKLEDCTTPNVGRGYCAKHYQRLMKYGDPLYMKKNTGGYDLSIDPDSGLLNRVLDSLALDFRGCWVWQKSVIKAGYGSVRVDGRWWSTHRYVYSTLVGGIPEGLELDHLCHTRRCCNPDHLEPVTHLENVRRGRAYRTGTHCRKSHEYTPENTYVEKSGYRRCRACQNQNAKNYLNRKKENNR